MLFKRKNIQKREQSIIIPDGMIKKTDESIKQMGMEKFFSVSFEEYCKQNNIKEKPNNKL